MSATLRFDNIGKVFPGVRALDGVSFDVNVGQVHGLMGENGAGKSTLLKILGGEYQPDSGRVMIDGNEVRFTSAASSIAAGIAVIHQELQYVPDLTVAENLLLGQLPNSLGWVNKREAKRFVRERLEAMGVALDPNAKLRKLSIAQRQMVEICKALLRNARVIALDEPTSSLSHRETEVLFKLVRDLRADNRAMIYISHRMDEIYELCDACTIFRDGRKIASHPTLEGVSRDTIVSEMVGREIADIYNYSARPLGEVRFAAKAIEGHALAQPASYTAPITRRPAKSYSTASRSRCAVRVRRSGTASCCVRKTARKKASSRWRPCRRTSISVAAAIFCAPGCSSIARKKRKPPTVLSSC